MKIVLITGSTGGLGRAVVRRFLEAGDTVAAVFRDEAKFRELEAAASAGHGALHGFKADVTSEAGVRQMVEAVLGRFGRIDALLNLVGGYRGGADLSDTSEEDWDGLMLINLKSAFLCSKAVLPTMTKAASGRLVCVAARPAVEKKGRAKSGAYAVAKAGVVALTEVLAEEGRKFNITANCILPGSIDTPENRVQLPAADFSKWTRPDDIASVLAFLVSDAAAIISGAAIPVYGKS